ncbi:MAG: hypothetical protein ABI907_05920 [Ramlibacter sp.]
MREHPHLHAWEGACALLGALALGVAAIGLLAPPLQDPAAHPLAWDAVGWVLRPWTLWTAAWVPGSAGSLAGNLLAVVALAVAGVWLGAGRAAAVALLLAWPIGIGALLLWPAVTSYAGLGGPIHAAAMVLWAHLVLRGSHKPLSFIVLCGVGLKLLAEGAWIQPVAFDPSWGGNIVYAAHLTGAVSGAVCGLVCGAVARLRQTAN